MIKILVKTLVKDHKNIKDTKVRERYGVLAGVLGIVNNLVLFILKFLIGIYMNSIAVISDAFNNLSDIGSSVVTIIGAKMSNISPDKEHPFGHGRAEYISSLIVSFLIILVGIELLKDSYKKILSPAVINYNTAFIIVLFATIAVKLWMFCYNRYLSKKINSGVLMAAARDSFNDIAATFVVILSVLLGKFTPFPLDGILGLLVSLMIVYSGYSIARDTIGILLGSSPCDELVCAIEETVLKQEGIVGVHDLIIHDYGPGRKMASIHAEVPIDSDIVKTHEVIDRAEQLIFDEFGVNMLIHTDPIITDCNKTKEIKSMLKTAIKELNQDLSIQDFRISEQSERINLIFDLVVPCETNKEQKEEIIKALKQKLKEKNKNFELIIKIDNSFK